MEQLGSQWTDFNEKNLYCSIIRKSVEKIQVVLKSDRKQRVLYMKTYVFMAISRCILLRMRNVSEES
jgi:hypothetical protein